MTERATTKEGPGVTAWRRSMTRIALAVALAAAVAAAGRADFDSGAAAYRAGDFAAALEAFVPLAENGDARAQFTLGYMHQFGQGVPQSAARAAQWYRRAAEQDHAGAQYNLGQFYQDGRGVEHDPVRAYMWFDLASEGGVAFATASRNATARQMSPAEIAEARRLAREWRARRR